MESASDESEAECESDKEPTTSEDLLSGDSSQVVLAAKPNVKANVWRFFGLETDSQNVIKDTNSPICRIGNCRMKVKTKQSSTSNLYSHLRKHHPQEYEAVRPPKAKKKSLAASKTIEEAFKQSIKLPRNSKEHKEITKAITYYLAKDMRPMYSVELLGFQRMINALNPRYDLPSRSYFSRTAVPSLYIEVRDQLQAELNTQTGFYSATTDLWTSRSNDPFITFTVHFIDNSWQLRSKCLSTVLILDDHTGENVKDAITEILSDWNLDLSKLVAITTDSASNMKRACSLLNLSRLSCFGHNLDLAVRKACDDVRITRVVKVCHQIVAKFSQSWKKKRDLATTQHEKELPVHKLKADCPTRWGSTLDMLKRIIEQQEAIRIVLASDRKASHLIPSWQDFDVMEAVVSALGPLGELTDALSAEKNVTVSVIRPLLDRITKEILMEKEGDCSLTAQMKRAIQIDLESRYTSSEVLKLLEICSFLDPRFKRQDTTSDVARSVEDEMLSSLQNNPLPSQQDNQPDCPPPKKSLLKKILENSEPDNSSDKVLSNPELVSLEVQKYTLSPKADLDSCPLQWWKAHQKELPLLARLARRYLCICATSVPSERVFSTGGKVVTDGRNVVKPQSVDQLVFLACNLR